MTASGVTYLIQSEGYWQDLTKVVLEWDEQMLAGRSYYTFPDGEPFFAFGVSFHPPVKPEGMLNIETLLGLGGTLLFQPL